MADYESVLKGKYPAKAHCEKVVAHLRNALDDKDVPTTFYLQGQTTHMQEDNDEAAPFRQRRHFLYLSGCLLPDCHLTYHIPTSSLTLFIPPLDPDSVIWAGLPLSPSEALEKYDIDACHTNDELSHHLLQLGPTLFTIGRGDIPIPPSDLASAFPTINESTLHPTIDTCRVTKDFYEIALLRKANAITAAAHIAALRKIPTATNETELVGQFLCSCVSAGAKKQAYGGIFGCGANAATLHYQHNDEALAPGKRVVLIDAAAEWAGYCADVTRTMPLHPEGFDRESAQIYVVVEQMQNACFALLRAGVRWEDVHELAHEIAVEGLLSIGILRGEKREIMRARTSVAFFPHGLGHYLGMDCHDTGGNANYEDEDTMFRYLRVRGTVPEGAVVTVEPGVYFCRFIVEPYLRDERHKGFIDEEVLERYWDVGGVRIEDDVVITRDGYENLTTAPKGIEEMMRVMYSQAEG